VPNAKVVTMRQQQQQQQQQHTVILTRYDTIEEFSVDSKAE